MRLQTQINIRFELIERLNAAFSSAENLGSSSYELQGEIGKMVRGHKKWNKVPRDIRSYVEGYQACKQEEAYRNMTWGFVYKEKFYKWDDLPEEGKENQRMVAGCNDHRDLGARVWTRFLPEIRRFT